jgi:peptide/nickel transport system substrate-binding protein
MGKNQKELSRRNFLELVAVGAAGAAVTGLGVTSAFSAAAKTPQVKAGIPKRGGTLREGVGWLIQTPDAHRRQGGWARVHMSFIYEGLTTPTPQAERASQLKQKGGTAVTDVKPMLASNWEIEKGGTRYVFHLKKGVKFHNGKELDSKDVEWNWKRIQDPVHLASSRKFLTLYLKSIETPDKYTVVANLSQPYGAFLMANAWPFTPLMPKDAVPHGVIWGETQTFTPPTPGPPGTGPFKLVSFQQKAEAVMEAHKEYRIPGLPYIDKVILKVIPEPGPQTMAVRAGDIDFAYGPLDMDWVAKMLAGKELYKVQILEKEGLGIHTMGNWPSTIYLNSHPEKGNSPFKDERVRKAMDSCLDRAKIAATLWGRMGIPTGQGFDQNISPWYFTDINYSEQNIPKAKKLLQEAGYPNGLDVNFSIDPSWGRQDLLAQIVQQMARPAGFRIKIVPELGVQYWNRLTTYEYHMLHFQLGMEDPMNFYYPSLHTDPAEPFNGRSPSLGIKDPEMDKLLDAMAGENSFEKRKAAFKKVVLRSQEKAYWLPYVTPVGARIWNKKIKNFKPDDYFTPEAALVEAWLDV